MNFKIKNKRKQNKKKLTRLKKKLGFTSPKNVNN